MLGLKVTQKYEKLEFLNDHAPGEVKFKFENNYYVLKAAEKVDTKKRWKNVFFGRMGSPANILQRSFLSLSIRFIKKSKLAESATRTTNPIADKMRKVVLKAKKYLERLVLKAIGSRRLTPTEKNDPNRKRLFSLKPLKNGLENTLEQLEARKKEMRVFSAIRQSPGAEDADYRQRIKSVQARLQHGHILTRLPEPKSAGFSGQLQVAQDHVRDAVALIDQIGHPVEAAFHAFCKEVVGSVLARGFDLGSRAEVVREVINELLGVPAGLGNTLAPSVISTFLKSKSLRDRVAEKVISMLYDTARESLASGGAYQVGAQMAQAISTSPGMGGLLAGVGGRMLMDLPNGELDVRTSVATAALHSAPSAVSAAMASVLPTALTPALRAIGSLASLWLTWQYPKVEIQKGLDKLQGLDMLPKWTEWRVPESTIAGVKPWMEWARPGLVGIQLDALMNCVMPLGTSGAMLYAASHAQSPSSKLAAAVTYEAMATGLSWVFPPMVATFAASMLSTPEVRKPIAATLSSVRERLMKDAPVRDGAAWAWRTANSTVRNVGATATNVWNNGILGDLALDLA